MIAALAAEAGREPGVRPAFTAHVKASIEKMAAHFPWPSKRNGRGDAVRALCTLSGAIALARAVDDPALSEEILREALAGLVGEEEAGGRSGLLA